MTDIRERVARAMRVAAYEGVGPHELLVAASYEAWNRAADAALAACGYQEMIEENERMAELLGGLVKYAGLAPLVTGVIYSEGTHREVVDRTHHLLFGRAERAALAKANPGGTDE